MRVVRLHAVTEPVIFQRGRSLPRADDPGDNWPEPPAVLVVKLLTDGGATGTGVAVVGSAAETCRAALDELFLPVVKGADPRQTGRLDARARQTAPGVTRGGIEALAWSAVDAALWDLKAQAAGQSLAQLLGGVRDAVPAYFAETIWPGLSADRVVELARPAMEAGAAGLWVGVNGRDPVRDANKLQRVREDLGDDVWFGVCGHEGLDTNTALAFGQFLEEELDADLYADPIPVSHLDGLARLSGSLGLPVGAGSTLGSGAFAELVTRGCVPILRPDLGRIGGVTPMLKLTALAELHHRSVMPSGPTAVLAQLGCALAAVSAVDDVSWSGVLDGPALRRVDGRIAPAGG
jgi:L-alanine-DL-glutamate epimerase-like enolase superfamily enzyme